MLKETCGAKITSQLRMLKMKTILVGDLHLKVRLILPLVTQATSQVGQNKLFCWVTI